MKQLKFLMIVFTLMMGVSFTSCLDDNGGGNSTYDAFGYMRTRTYMGTYYFYDLVGNTYYPTSTSLEEMKKSGFEMSSSTDLVFVYFKYVDTTSTDTKATGSTQTPQTYTIDLVGITSIDSYDAKIMNTVEDMENMVTENAPVVTLEPTDNYGTYKPGFYGNEMLIIPVAWKMADKKEALSQHTMNLVYVADEVSENSKELVFYLRHDRGTDEKAEVPKNRNKAYRIEYILENFKEKTGNYPTKITIKAKIGNDMTLPKEYTNYSIENIEWK